MGLKNLNFFVLTLYQNLNHLLDLTVHSEGLCIPIQVQRIWSGIWVGFWGTLCETFPGQHSHSPFSCPWPGAQSTRPSSL